MKTDQTGQIVKRDDHENTLATALTRSMSAIVAALPKNIVTPERMMRLSLTALRTSKTLRECTTVSFLGNVIQAAQLGLEPNTPLGQCYLIPRKNRKSGDMECTLIIGYQGLLELVRRSNLVGIIEGSVVREGDQFIVTRGTDSSITHVESGDQGRHKKPITHVYALAWLKGETRPIFVVLTRDEIELRRARGGNSEYGPWSTDYEAMALKTALRVLCWRWLPKSAELARACVLDETPELGRSQASAWDTAVIDAMSREGHEVNIVDVADEQTDPVTGEVTEVAKK